MNLYKTLFIFLILGLVSCEQKDYSDDLRDIKEEVTKLRDKVDDLSKRHDYFHVVNMTFTYMSEQKRGFSVRFIVSRGNVYTRDETFRFEEDLETTDSQKQLGYLFDFLEQEIPVDRIYQRSYTLDTSLSRLKKELAKKTGLYIFDDLLLKYFTSSRYANIKISDDTRVGYFRREWTLFKPDNGQRFKKDFFLTPPPPILSPNAMKYFDKPIGDYENKEAPSK